MVRSSHEARKISGTAARHQALGPLSATLAERLSAVVPGGSSTISKQARLAPVEPGVIVRGQGCRVWDADGREFIDFKSGLGPISLGWCHPEVDSAVATQLTQGIVFGQPSPLEGQLAEELVALLKWADQVRFLKTGGEAVAACIKIARAHTGRDHVVHIGYNGWLSGLSRQARTLPGAQADGVPAGVPAAVADLHHQAEWGDADEVTRLLEQHDGRVAAVVVAADYEHMEEGARFLPELRRLTHRHGTLLVLDEIVTGLRVAVGGAGEYFSTEPDLAVFAKGLANGMPLAAYAGRRDVLSALDRAVVTSTNAGETLSLAAALAVVEVHRRDDVVGHLWRQGRRWWAGVDDTLALHGLPYRTAGFAPCRAILPRAGGPSGVSALLQAGFAHGLVLHDVSYVNLAHDDAAVDEALDRFDAACAWLAARG